MSDQVELFRVRFDRLVEEIKRGICVELDTKASALFALFQEELQQKQQSAGDQENQVVTGDDPNDGNETTSGNFQADEADSVSVKSESVSEGEWENNENNQRNMAILDDHMAQENFEDNEDEGNESECDCDDCVYHPENAEDIEVRGELNDGDQEGTEEREEDPSGTDQVVPIASTSYGLRRSSRKPVKRKDLSPDDTATSDDDDSDRDRYRAERKRKSARVDSSPAVRTEVNHEDTSGPEGTKKIITRYLNCTVPGCVMKCEDKAKLKEHLKNKHGFYLDRCHVRGCKATFANQFQITDHLDSAHGKLTSWPCDICTVQFPNYHGLKMHVWRNHEQGLFACGYTGCRVTSHINRRKVIDHQYQHNPGTHQCTFAGCSKAFKRANILKKHLVTHTGEKAFRCVTCDTAFAQKWSLTTHLKTSIHRFNAERAAPN